MDDELSGVNKTARTADRVAGLAYGALHPPVAHDRLSCMDIRIGVSSVGFRIARSLDLHSACRASAGPIIPVLASRRVPWHARSSKHGYAARGAAGAAAHRHPDCGYPGGAETTEAALAAKLLPSQDANTPASTATLAAVHASTHRCLVTPVWFAPIASDLPSLGTISSTAIATVSRQVVVAGHKSELNRLLWCYRPLWRSADDSPPGTTWGLSGRALRAVPAAEYIDILLYKLRARRFPPCYRRYVRTVVREVLVVCAL